MAAAAPPPGSSPSAPTEIKMLMLHGYTQSGPLFRSKTRALERFLAKALAPHGLAPILFYPTGPVRLLPSDVPGYDPATGRRDDEELLPDSWAWFLRQDAAAATSYRRFDQGIDAVADAIRLAGGVDAICGFSQGAALAALVAAALEPDRRLPDSDGDDDLSRHWAHRLREANAHRPLLFAVLYSGFFAPVDSLAWCYQPTIATPTLHYLGSLDTVVDESRSRALIDCCQDPVLVLHPGGHHVPISKEWLMPLVTFIKRYAPGPRPLEPPPLAHV